MKKTFFITALFILAFMAGSFAQSAPAGRSTMKELTVKLADGNNSIAVPEGKGTIKFVKRGDKISDVVYTDAAGKSSRMQSSTIPGARPCKCPIPDACYSIPNNQSIGMCICKACDLSSGEHIVTIWLPAIQKVRDAAN